MYLFVFSTYSIRTWLSLRWKSPKQKASPPSSWGAFRQDNIRKALGSDYKIFDIDTHPLAQAMTSMGYEHPLDGLVVEITDPKLAIWLKLNHENIVSPSRGTRLMNVYGPISMEEVEAIRRDWVNKSDRRKALWHQSNELSMIGNALLRLDKLEIRPDVSECIGDQSMALMNAVSADVRRLQALHEGATEISNAAQKAILAYLNEKKMC